MDLTRATVAQILIPVDDLERAVAFYRDTLGVPFLFTAPPQMAFFQCGAVRLLVGVPPSGPGGPRGSGVYFEVGDIHATHQTLTARGVEFQGQPHLVHRTAETELWLAEFRDPDGNPLALMATVPGAAVV
jgi:methylmalonyl-CoA/ethylmalonyl-CoA epimerase